MNHEFRALQQQARERQARLARFVRYRTKVYYLGVFVAVMTLLWTALILIGR